MIIDEILELREEGNTTQKSKLSQKTTDASFDEIGFLRVAEEPVAENALGIGDIEDNVENKQAVVEQKPVSETPIEPAKPEVQPVAEPVSSDVEVDEPIPVPQGTKTIFTLKMSVAVPVVQENYNRVNNAVFKYTRTSKRFAKNYVEYTHDGKAIARLVLNGNALKMYLPLPSGYVDPKVYFQKPSDIPGYKIYVNVKSEKSGKNAVALIEKIASLKDYNKRAGFTGINSIEELKEFNKR